MRNTFRYSKPRALNLTTYILFGSATLYALSRWGDQAWSLLTSFFGEAGTFVGVGFGVYLAIFWLVGGLYMALDHLDSLWFTQFKIQQRPPGVERRGPPLRKTIWVVLRNQFLGTLPAVGALYAFLSWKGLDMSAPIPSWDRILLDLAVFVLIEELLFYTVHRTLHRPHLFRKIHRIHHEFRESIGITTHYVHYLEHMFGNLLPVFAGMMLWTTHPVVFFLWIVLAVVNAIHTHSGYALPWMSYAVDHDFHHYNINGQYGVLGVLDRIFGTDQPLKALANRSTVARVE